MTTDLFLTRVNLNPRRRATKLFLANTQALHAAVAACFPPDSLCDGRSLWRTNTHPNGVGVVLYIMSPVRPDTRHIVEQAGWESSPGETVSYIEVLDACTKGQTVMFELVGNPTRCVRGKKVELATVDQQLDWLHRKASNHGFDVDDAAVVDVKRTHGRRRGSGRLSHQLVRFRGQLTVTNPEAFAEAVAGGIGRAKAYGAGMMLLAPIREG